MWAHGVNMNKRQHKQTNKDEKKWIITEPQTQAGIIFKVLRPWSSSMQQNIHHAEFFLSDRAAERTFHWIEMDGKSFGSRQPCLQFCRQNYKIDELLLILIMAPYQYHWF